MTREAEWIAVDWGTSNVRAWAFDESERSFAQTSSARGMAKLRPSEFESALLELIGGWLSNDRIMPIFACGMVGARQGWIEAPYAKVPCEPLSPDSFTTAPTTDRRIAVRIAGGLCQSEPPDVIRGEETQIAGLLAERPGFDGIACMPGTHTKWVEISDGRVIRFKSFISGELFSLLQNHSVLRHSLASENIDLEAFENELDRLIGGSGAPLAAMFSLRAEDLLFETPPEVLRAKLSAALIAAEVDAAKSYWTGHCVALIGEQSLSKFYGLALNRLGVRTETPDTPELTLAGLRVAKSYFAADGAP